MASGKILKKRIASVKNTSKITRTMEMVASAKSRRLMDRVHKAKPYSEKILAVMAGLGGIQGKEESPLLEVRPEKKIALVIITANRGLCGGYNSNVIKMARNKIKEYQSRSVAFDLFVVGKKGNAYFRFVKVPVARSIIDIDDKFEYAQAEELANFFIDAYTEKKYDRVEVLSTFYLSAANQRPGSMRLLPISNEPARFDENGEPLASREKFAIKERPANFIIEPGPAVIIARMLPLVVKVSLFKLFLEAIASEQIYRRIAMKAATDAAKQMIKLLTRTYNRIRQASITQELAEIVAGADAL